MGKNTITWNFSYYAALNMQICNYAQNRCICCENSKYAADKIFYGHFCARRKAANFCHPAIDYWGFYQRWPPPSVNFFLVITVWKRLWPLMFFGLKVKVVFNCMNHNLCESATCDIQSLKSKLPASHLWLCSRNIWSIKVTIRRNEIPAVQH